MKIGLMDSGHFTDVKNIYQQGIDTGDATFESSPPPSWQAWNKKFLSNLSLVCLDNEKVIGWAAISQVSTRKVYQGVGEISLYISEEYRGQGIGKKLMERIISESEQAGFWTLQASIFPENIISIHLHENAGFRIFGERHRIAKMTYGPWKGQWRDTLLLERRSEKIG